MLKLIFLFSVLINFVNGLFSLRNKDRSSTGSANMALIKMGAIVVDMRGKIGGTVFSKGRSGNIARNKVTPVNPKTSAQSAAKNRLTYFSQAWRSLTQAQRNAWNAAVGQFQTTNIFGDSVSPTGKNLYSKLNINLELVGVSAIDDAPSPEDVPSMDTIALSVANGADTMSLGYTATPVPANSAFLIRMTAGMSAGRSFVSSEFRLVSILDAADASPEDLKAAYNTVFGSIPAAGTKIFIEVVGINKTTGQKGTPLQSYAVVSA